MYTCDKIEFIWNYSANLNIVSEGAFLPISQIIYAAKIHKTISALALEKA